MCDFLQKKCAIWDPIFRIKSESETNYSITKNEFDDSKEILEDLKEVKELLEGIESDDEPEVEAGDTVMIKE